MSNIFSDEAWEQYTQWQLKDRAIARKINDKTTDLVYPNL